MLTNATCTIYRNIGKDIYKRVPVGAVFWQETAAISIQKYGLQNANRVTIFMALSDNFEPKTGDIIVKGNVAMEFDGTHKISELAQEHIIFKAVSVDKKDYGSENIRHWEVGAK